MDNFKVPQILPQDLLLIQELVDIPLIPNREETPPLGYTLDSDDDINSSGSESEDEQASEEEIATDLTKGSAADDEVRQHSEPASSETSSDSSCSSDSDDSEGEEAKDFPGRPLPQDFDDDEDPLPASTPAGYFTKNEITDADIKVPRVEKISPEERLEKVGEIMNIVDRVAIIRGLRSEYLNRASDRTLDSDTLLVFEDREAMGYIYETFGPTLQPLYQVKFSDSFPLDPNRVRVGREVFHVPAQSKFVFVSQIKGIRGSDASNVYDEEPGDDELEFSDDEAEAAHRNRFKRKRAESRSRSVALSRSATPNPTMMRDQDLAATDEVLFSGNAYDEHGPYDIDYASLPSIPSSSSRSLPFDDPYADSYVAPGIVEAESEPSLVRDRSFDRDRPSRGRGRGRANRGRRHGDWGSARGARHGGGHHPRHHQEAGHSPKVFIPNTQITTGQVGYPGYQHQEYSPLYPDQQLPGPISMHYPHSTLRSYQYADSQAVLPGVQPHINPRFASAFGLSVHPAFPQEQTHESSSWADEWTIPMLDPGGFRPDTQSSGDLI